MHYLSAGLFSPPAGEKRPAKEEKYFAAAGSGH
jgi:hypothetical protein